MTARRRTAGGIALASVAALLASAAPTRAADAPSPAPAGARDAGPQPDLEAVLARVAPAVVTVQFLLRYEGGFETTDWAHGVVVDPSGLVLLASGNVGGGDAKLADVKVLLGADPKEWPAVLVARDSTLDLAYVQVLGDEGRPFAHVDLDAAAARKPEPRLGEPLCGVTRTGRAFDYAPSVRRLYFTTRIEAPRRMWDFAGEFGEAGLPVFDATGQPVAVLSRQSGTEGADEGGGSSTDTFALPLSTVVKSLEQARKRVPEAVRKAAEARKDGEARGDAEPAKPAPDAAPGGEKPGGR
ncbi:MAG: serine protease [Planctomycetes bacterium]|nr:serine protease [Planctomycetota bacterium]